MKKYKLHIIIFAALMGLSIISMVVGYSSGLTQKEQQYGFLSSLPYEYCYEFSGEDYPANSYIDLNEAYSAKAHGKTIKSDKLMQLRDVTGIWDNVPTLQPDEVYLSVNLLDVHGLEIGDVISIQSPSSPESKSYRIAGELPPCYGLYQDFTDTNRGIIIFGLDETFLANNSANFVTYQDTSFKPSEVNAQLVSLFSVREQTKSVRAELLQAVALMWCILLVADIIVSSYLCTRYYGYMRKLWHSGLSGFQVTSKLCRIVTSPLLLCRGVMLMVGIVTLATTGEYAVLLVNLIELLLVIVMTFIQKKLIERGV